MPSAWRWPSASGTPLRRRLVDHRTWVIAGDGCLMEGISQEAIGLAGHLKLEQADRAVGRQRITIDGGTSPVDSGRPARRASPPPAGMSSGVRRPRPGRDRRRDLQAWATSTSPLLIACKTIIGYGAPTKAGTAGSAWLAARRGRDRRRQAPSWAGSTPRSKCPTIATAWRSRRRARRAPARLGSALASPAPSAPSSTAPWKGESARRR
jgi:transketolase